MSISLDEIRAMFRAENAAMLDTAVQRLDAMLEKALQRMESASAAMPEKTLQRMESECAAMPENTVQKLEGVIDEMPEKTLQTESASAAMPENTAKKLEGVIDEKLEVQETRLMKDSSEGLGSHARDLAAERRHDYVTLQLAVVEKLVVHADVCDLGDRVFTPNIRTSVRSLALQMLGTSCEAVGCARRLSCTRTCPRSGD